jgi:predicted metal-dependent peptidase
MTSIVNRTFTLEETLQISSLIASHDIIFQTFWCIGKPIFTNSIKTAAVGFDKVGKVIYLIINPDFWDSLNITNKVFVICHEALHVILNHGKRGNEYPDQKMVNFAQDIVINEMLVYSFGFNKFEITNWDKYCFVETVFTSEEIIEHKIHTKGSFHYYMHLMEKQKDQNKDLECVDQHGSMKGDPAKDDSSNPQTEKTKEEQEIENLIKAAQEHMNEAANTIKEEIDPMISEVEKYDFAQKIKIDFEGEPSGAGCTPMGALITSNQFYVKKKKKWEHIVKKHLKSMTRYETVEVDSWISRKRSHSCLSPELMIEGAWSQEKAVKEKYRVVFFLDSSGSCLHHAKRFVTMLQSIPDDSFHIEAYAFDNHLYPIDLKTGQVRGGGGTYFTILDKRIREITAKSRHPDAVFVLSDGDGDIFHPEKPKLWHWILTPRHSLRYIPKESQKHDMANFE